MLLAAFAPLGYAQATVRLDFPDEGSRDVWFAPALPKGPPDAALNTKAKSIEVPLTKAGPKDKLFVWDRKTGNMAVRALSDVKGVWAVKAEDFKLIGLVRVKVEHEGNPVAAAYVTLKDKSRTQGEELDSSAKGVAEFYAVVPGKVVEETTYRTEGKTQPPLQQVFELSLQRTKPEVDLGAEISDDVETVGEKKPATGAEAPSETSQKPPAKVESRPNVFLQLLFTLAVLGGAGVGIYYLFQYLNKNADKVQLQLQKMGVQVPDPSPGDPSDSIPARPAAPPPPERIILDDPALAPAAASPQAAPIAAPMGIGSTMGNPRLVGDGGQTFQLAEGVNLVSREGGAPIFLPGENSVSRRHAEVVRQGARVTVRDLGSTNGTYVNGVKLVGETTLNPGDVVLFGTVRLRFEG
jgi:hypothetical protein